MKYNNKNPIKIHNYKIKRIQNYAREKHLDLPSRNALIRRLEVYI